ncbi:MAG: cobalamin-dependent protein [Deltaproteobacteria bacterium]|nr:cobalamin-dependent protein [Deltaproteobacteria bacterium]
MVEGGEGLLSLDVDEMPVIQTFSVPDNEDGIAAPVRNSRPTILLINPWIYDFAAYDYFARPLGLLYLAGWLRAQGFAVHLLDCLDVPHSRPGPGGTGRYPKEIVPTPAPLSDIPRRYGRYGLTEVDFRSRLSRLPRPDVILVTSLMTYWYPGVTTAIALVREHFPEVPVILGGIYASLCPDHARANSGADLVLPGPWETGLPPHLAGLGLGRPSVPDSLDALPYPALDLLAQLSYIPILASRGCPLDCDYCASKLLQPAFRPRHPHAVAAELRHWQDHLGLQDVAFYDDALLINAPDHLLVILEELLRQGCTLRYHTPNGLHARLITREVAGWLKRAGFAALRLGVETTALGEDRADRKLQAGELEAALACLREAGFPPKAIGVYLLAGLPGQDETVVAASIHRVKQLGATPVLAYYSPIPGTTLWRRACECSRYDLAAEPLCHNNSLFPCLPQFSWDSHNRLKHLAAA